MITIADLKQHLEQFNDDAMIVFRADTERELYDDEGRLNAAFVEWLMGLPCAHAVGLSRTASIRLAGNAVVRLQRGLTAINNTKGAL